MRNQSHGVVEDTIRGSILVPRLRKIEFGKLANKKNKKTIVITVEGFHGVYVFYCFQKRDPGRLTWWGEIESLNDVDRGCGRSNKNLDMCSLIGIQLPMPTPLNKKTHIHIVVYKQKSTYEDKVIQSYKQSNHQLM